MNTLIEITEPTLKSCSLILGLLMAFAPSSFGSAITFTDITTASGTLGSTSFTNDLVKISATGDTSTIQPISVDNGFFIDDNSASVTIDGLGSFLFTTATAFFVNNTVQIVGFSRGTGLDLIDGPIDPSFSSWSMLTSIGPVTGSGNIFQWTLTPVLTTGGTLVLTDASPNVTFSATVGSVPEPDTLLLQAASFLAFLGIWLMRRR